MQIFFAIKFSVKLNFRFKKKKEKKKNKKKKKKKKKSSKFCCKYKFNSYINFKFIYFIFNISSYKIPGNFPLKNE